MRKKLYLFVLLWIPFTMHSQDFDAFEDMQQVTTVVVNETMFKLLAKIEVDLEDPEAKEFMDIAKSIKDLKVFITEDKAIGGKMQIAVNQYLKKNALQQLMRVKEKDKHVRFYVKQGHDLDHVQELLMFVTANTEKAESVLLSLTGDIDLNKINALTKKMNLPKELENASKK